MAPLESAKNGVFCFNKLKFERNKGSYMTCGDSPFFNNCLFPVCFIFVLFCFVLFRFFFSNLRHFFRYACAYVRTGSYAPGAVCIVKVGTHLMMISLIQYPRKRLVLNWNLFPAYLRSEKVFIPAAVLYGWLTAGSA